MKQRGAEIFGQLMEHYPELGGCGKGIIQAFNILVECYASGGKLLICGNGGSAADSEHMAGELMKGFLLKRPVPEEDAARLRSLYPEEGGRLAENLQGALPAISLVGQTAFSTAFTNDVCADMVFAQQVYGYGRPGDVLAAFTTSGNSANVLHAVRTARFRGMRVIAFTGVDGGRSSPLCNAVIKIPVRETYRVQEYHLPVYHALCAMLEEEFFGNE